MTLHAQLDLSSPLSPASRLPPPPLSTLVQRAPHPRPGGQSQPHNQMDGRTPDFYQVNLTRLFFVLFCFLFLFFFQERPFCCHVSTRGVLTLCVVGRRMSCAFRSLSCMCDLPHHGTQTGTQETLPPAREKNCSLCGLHAIIVACRSARKNNNNNNNCGAKQAVDFFS